MQTFSDKFMQLRQEALAVITELQKWHKNDFRIMEPINKSGGKEPDEDFINASIQLWIHDVKDCRNVRESAFYPYAIGRGYISFVTPIGYQSIILVEDLIDESIFVLADWILANHPIQKPGEDKV